MGTGSYQAWTWDKIIYVRCKVLDMQDQTVLAKWHSSYTTNCEGLSITPNRKANQALHKGAPLFKQASCFSDSSARRIFLFSLIPVDEGLGSCALDSMHSGCSASRSQSVRDSSGIRKDQPKLLQLIMQMPAATLLEHHRQRSTTSIHGTGTHRGTVPKR